MPFLQADTALHQGTQLGGQSVSQVSGLIHSRVGAPCAGHNLPNICSSPDSIQTLSLSGCVTLGKPVPFQSLGLLICTMRG